MKAELKTTSPATGPAAARVELALWAMCQVESLVPIAQGLADNGGDDDAMLGILGRVQHLNQVAMRLLTDEAADLDLDDLRVQIKGPANRRAVQVSHHA